MTIVFFGSDPWFSPPVLEAILKAKHQISLVVTKGNAFENFRTKNPNLRFVDARTEEDILRFMNGNRPDVVVLAAFGPPFLPAEVLSWPKYGCLNVHASLLPRWRGASPVFGAIANGDKETGVSIMKMTEKIDLGPVLGQKITIIRSHLGVRQGETFPDNDDRESLTRRLGILGGELIAKTLNKLENGQIKEVKQPAESPTPYTHRLTKDSGKIDWEKPPEEVEMFIRAVTPWPGAVTSARFKIQDSRFMIQDLKILKAHLEESSQQQDCHTPQSGVRNDGFLIIDLVQLPSKNPISWKAFLAGHPKTTLE